MKHINIYILYIYLAKHQIYIPQLGIILLIIGLYMLHTVTDVMVR